MRVNCSLRGCARLGPLLVWLRGSIMLVPVQIEELQLCCCSLHVPCCYFHCIKPYGEKVFIFVLFVL
jgi:hypothetical protein